MDAAHLRKTHAFWPSRSEGLLASCRKSVHLSDLGSVMSHSRLALRESVNTASCVIVNENPNPPPH